MKLKNKPKDRNKKKRLKLPEPLLKKMLPRRKLPLMLLKLL